MKHVIVTGAAQGIGYFFAEELLAKGYVVTVLDLEPERLAPLAEKFENLLALQCDVQNAQQIKTAVQKAISTFGPPVCAVHNACLCPFGPVEGTPETRFRDAYEVNTLGALRLSKAVLPYMKEQRGGRIIFTSSGVGVTGFADISPYASSKGAIESLAKCLAIEYADWGITFHLFHPPLTHTASSAPLPVPKEMMANPEAVGKGLARHMGDQSFVICHSFSQRLQTRLCYHFPLAMGRMMSRMTARYQKTQQTGG